MLFVVFFVAGNGLSSFLVGSCSSCSRTFSYLVELSQSHRYYRRINYLQLVLEIELCLTLCDFFLLNVLMRSFSYELVTSNELMLLSRVSFICFFT